MIRNLAIAGILAAGLIFTAFAAAPDAVEQVGGRRVADSGEVRMEQDLDDRHGNGDIFIHARCDRRILTLFYDRQWYGDL